MSTPAVVESLEVTDPIEARFDEVLTPGRSSSSRPSSEPAATPSPPAAGTTPGRCPPEMAVSDQYSDFLTLPAYERMP